MQGTGVQSLVWEDPTCYGAMKPWYHNYQACVLQLMQPTHPKAQEPQPLSTCAATTEARTPRACAPQETPLQWEAALQQRVAPLTASRECHAQQRRPSATKNKNKFLKDSDEITWSLSQCSPTVSHHTTMVQMGHTCANTLTPNHSVSWSPFHVTHCPVKPASVCTARCAES